MYSVLNKKPGHVTSSSKWSFDSP